MPSRRNQPSIDLIDGLGHVLRVLLGEGAGIKARLFSLRGFPVFNDGVTEIFWWVDGG